MIKIGWIDRFRGFIRNSKRVMRLSRKPTFTEVRLITRVCLLGVAIIGLVGFIIKIIFSAIFGI
ncbi:MAG: protein translocase SEC61 complex subunit gamma [Candidatus Helarchaeota archaeon]|nr:protein translocase SEC61 complex subunit gamma [Candidatus Helarchaeota archaeon]